MTIVRQFVESNRGTVAIEDRPGGGTRMRLPLMTHVAEASAAAAI